MTSATARVGVHVAIGIDVQQLLPLVGIMPASLFCRQKEDFSKDYDKRRIEPLRKKKSFNESSQGN